LNSRKQRLPGAGLTLMDRIVPLSGTVSDGVIQWVVFSFLVFLQYESG